jgi:hypothetical protein
VDVSQEVIIREVDCSASQGITVSEIVDNGRVIEDFAERLLGRYPLADVIHPETGEVIVLKTKMMDEGDTDRIIASGIKELTIRSVLNCESKNGICSFCYGSNLSNGQPVAIGEVVALSRPSPSASRAPSSPCAPSTRAASPPPPTSRRVFPASTSCLRRASPSPPPLSASGRRRLL